eukprot:SAG31_NODE_3740_length_3932_cov_3.662145_1_plen_144_part_10
MGPAAGRRGSHPHLVKFAINPGIITGGGTIRMDERRRLGRLSAVASHLARTSGSATAATTALTPTTQVSESSKLHAESSKFLPLGVASQFRATVTEVPRFFTHADGCWHYDVDGNRMLDYTLAWGPLILGSKCAPLPSSHPPLS